MRTEKLKDLVKYAREYAAAEVAILPIYMMTNKK